ncbi:MAG TPA: D,D-heptose 1,7-bisphosphate phosphatase [Cytophagales bacterium]|nr:D,D-heptose 1,7-bisphosphate phosphatase [Cytophagales bacterium]HAA21859.1 D,D-heptose 1,7-bisphosphate phosphatase [Cytophagales bacterium]HAP60127.1 D,D-heptose 1,7-bisphosphate phosphatase [Cytophagales bacterium]
MGIKYSFVYFAPVDKLGPIHRHKAVFLDRDGVLNEERGQHTYRLEDFIIRPGVPEALRLLKASGYYLVVITNQSGIARGMYTREQMQACHNYLHEVTDYVIDAVYYSPYHESITRSLGRKPGTLLFERALARFLIKPELSWMIGDKDRDLVPAHQLGIQTLMMGDATSTIPTNYRAHSMEDAANVILALG